MVATVSAVLTVGTSQATRVAGTVVFEPCGAVKEMPTVRKPLTVATSSERLDAGGQSDVRWLCHRRVLKMWEVRTSASGRYLEFLHFALATILQPVFR